MVTILVWPVQINFVLMRRCTERDLTVSGYQGGKLTRNQLVEVKRVILYQSPFSLTVLLAPPHATIINVFKNIKHICMFTIYVRELWLHAYHIPIHCCVGHNR